MAPNYFNLEVGIGVVHRYEPVNECIYCGATENLSDEHVIPFALSGRIVLPAASCDECATMTSKIELKVLRGILHPARLVGGYPSRKKKLQPKRVTERLIDQNGDAYEIEVDREDGLGLLVLPTVELPAFLRGGPNQPTSMTMNGYQVIYFGKESPEDFVKRHGAKGIQNQQVTFGVEVVQFLAKIAYGFAVGSSSEVRREDSPIPELLRTGIGQGNWVGSESFELKHEKEGATHAMKHYSEVDTAMGSASASVVQMKLFAASGAPAGYTVVTHAPNWREFQNSEGVDADGNVVIDHLPG